MSHVPKRYFGTWGQQARQRLLVANLRAFSVMVAIAAVLLAAIWLFRAV